MSSMKLPNIRRQQGVAMLEVLIVFFVLSIGLLGMAALQLKSIQYSQSSYMRSQATVAAHDILDRIRLNGGNEFNAGDDELDDWIEFVNGTLPTGGTDPTVVCNAPRCTVVITWLDRFDEDGDGSPDTQTLTVESDM